MNITKMKMIKSLFGILTFFNVVTADSQIFVANWLSGTIGEYTLSGATVNAALISGLSEPIGLALDGKGNLFVANVSSGTIGEYTTSGLTVNASLISGLNGPAGIALDGKGNLFVADQFNNRIGEYTTSGATVNASLISGLHVPEDILVVVPEPPTTTCSAPAILECENGAAVATVQTQAQDTNGNPLQVIWTVDGTPSQTNNIPSGGIITASNVTFTANFGLGEHVVVVSVSNGQTQPVTCSTTVTVRDMRPPRILNIVATPNVLWPPNHRLIPVNLMVEAVDNCDPSPVTRVTNVTSDEPQNPLDPDWEITGEHSLNLRAERLGKGQGRIYTIVVECKDMSGNVSTASVDVTVPHN
jgi:hypothetical protein